MSSRELIWQGKKDIGKTANGERVVVKASLYRSAGGKTIDHQELSQVETLSFDGETFSAEGIFESAGQIIDTLSEVAVGSPTIPAADVWALASLWRRWHLNEMRGGCIHQRAAEEGLLAAMNDTARRSNRINILLDQVPACEESGYRYGSAWLIEPLPADVIDQVKRIFADR